MLHEKRALVIIDVQPEFANIEQINAVEEYEKLHKNDYTTIVRTTFSNEKYSFFKRCLDYSECTYKEVIKDKYATKCIKKSTYQLPADLIYELKSYSTVDIIGCDTDACILAVSYQLFDSRINFRILEDLCFTSAESDIKTIMPKILRRNFGTCVNNSIEIWK